MAEYLRDYYTAEQKSRAIDALRGSVLILRHPYERDPLSGAGNCWCGRDNRSPLHNVVLAEGGETNA